MYQNITKDKGIRYSYRGGNDVAKVNKSNSSIGGTVVFPGP